MAEEVRVWASKGEQDHFIDSEFASDPNIVALRGR
jgi:hypothetical protein